MTSRRRRLEDWLKGATEHAGSWWPDWKAWITDTLGPSGSGAHRPAAAS